MYRELTAGVRGNDVLQFEKNLHELGYGGFTVDDHFTAATATVVKHWQHDLGLPETGTVGTGQVVYEKDAVRVAGRLVRPGAASPADVLTVTGTARLVTASVDGADAAWAVPGAKVSITLPGGATLPGVVVTAGESGGAADTGSGPGGKVSLAIAADDQKKLAGAGDEPLTVRHALRTKKDVLTVPVPALLALAEGGYGLELVGDDGSSRIVAVRAGMFAGGRVEVSGPGIEAGTTVRMPR